MAPEFETGSLKPPRTGVGPRKLASWARGPKYDDVRKSEAAKEKALSNLPRRRVRRTLQPVECTQDDPIGLAGGLNVYGFANGDPVNFSDPFGLDCRVAYTGDPCAADPANIIPNLKATVRILKAAGDALFGGGECDGGLTCGTGIPGAGPLRRAAAAGRTAAGRAIDRYGNTLGPSGKPMVNTVKHSTKKGAKDAARREGDGAPVNHPSPAKGEQHYHPTKAVRRFRTVRITSIRMSDQLGRHEVWIGLVSVTPRTGADLLGSAKGAWVTVLAWASNIMEYRSAVHEALSYYRLEVREVEDVEPLAARQSRATVLPNLAELAKEVEATGYARLGRFHTYEKDDEEDGHIQ